MPNLLLIYYDLRQGSYEDLGPRRNFAPANKVALLQGFHMKAIVRLADASIIYFTQVNTHYVVLPMSKDYKGSSCISAIVN